MPLHLRKNQLQKGSGFDGVLSLIPVFGFKKRGQLTRERESKKCRSLVKLGRKCIMLKVRLRPARVVVVVVVNEYIKDFSFLYRERAPTPGRLDREG